MPVLHVRALPQPHPEKIQSALKKTCIALAEVYGCKPSQVWATWEEIRPGFYVEGDADALVQPGSSHPPICDLICFEGRSDEIIEKVLVAASKTLTAELGIPDNIFMTYREALSGRVIAGNGVIRR
jgi:hypothetical protein